MVVAVDNFIDKALGDIVDRFGEGSGVMFWFYGFIVMVEDIGWQ